MIVCGLKLTHDGAVAVVDNGRLVFSVELEKIGNNRRYSKVSELETVSTILAGFGYDVAQIDRWVIDGWDGRDSGKVVTSIGGVPLELSVAGYRETESYPDLLSPSMSGELPLDGRPLAYESYTHAATHAVSAYCSSPFAAAGAASAILIWDGGMFPHLYWADPVTGRIDNGGELFPLFGHAYALAGFHFGPFRRGSQAGELWVAGKLMAYIALGTARPEILQLLRDGFAEFFDGESARAVAYRRDVGGYGSHVEPSREPVEEFLAALRAAIDPDVYPDEDVLASVHEFLSDLLVTRLDATLRAWRGDGPWNLCFAGGCALNIKWNSALRASPIVKSMWVPPFCNDSGSALGAAALGWVREAGLRQLDWTIRSGPELSPLAEPPPGWTSRPADVAEVAKVLHESGEPVVVLDGRSELGPRALGGRSILAAPTAGSMKDTLNDIKGRESYRPVAPICLVDEAPAIFDPGTPDPYMLFEHRVRPDWVRRIPAVLHLDGTARLQTVDPAEEPVLGEILRAYHRRSDVPVLCNTSANLNGCGFFPDVASAIAWGKVNHVWSAGILYTRLS